MGTAEEDQMLELNLRQGQPVSYDTVRTVDVEVKINGRSDIPSVGEGFFLAIALGWDGQQWRRYIVLSRDASDGGHEGSGAQMFFVPCEKGIIKGAGSGWSYTMLDPVCHDISHVTNFLQLVATACNRTPGSVNSSFVRKTKAAAATAAKPRRSPCTHTPHTA